MFIFPFSSRKKEINKAKETPYPLVLMILDGFGISPIKEGNAVYKARTKSLDALQRHFPKALLHTSGNEAGLPFGEFGNSEVGHLNIGSGRINYQPFLRVTRALERGDLQKNEVTRDLLKHIRKTKGALHFMGLLSSGGVHSHVDHIPFLLSWCKENNVKKIFFHIFTDGRDTPPVAAENYILDLEKRIKELDLNAKIASVSGRYFGMDRNKNWDRTKKAYEAIIGKSKDQAQNAKQAINIAYAQNKTDEFVDPTVIVDEKGKAVGPLSDGDAIMFFNYRPDRARQLVKALENKRFGGFKAKKFSKLYISTFTDYDPTLKVRVLFPEEDIKNPLSEVISKKKIKQFHIAETEKYAHVTYFLNGGCEKPNKDEIWEIIPSPKVSTYNKKPEMSAGKVAKRVLEELDKKEYKYYVINFANPDMVGHTGDFKAAVSAIEFMDSCVGEISKKVMDMGGAVLITSDHGNSEAMVNLDTGEVDTEHNIYPAPFIFAKKDLASRKEALTFKELISEPVGTLADIAPTVLDIMQIEKPEEMTGISLLDSLK